MMDVKIILPRDTISGDLESLLQLDVDMVTITPGVLVSRDSTTGQVVTQPVDTVDVRIDFDEPNWARARRISEKGYAKCIEAVEDEWANFVHALRLRCTSTITLVIDGVCQR